MTHSSQTPPSAPKAVENVFDDAFQADRYRLGIGVVGDGDPAFNRERSLLMRSIADDTRANASMLFNEQGQYRYRRSGD